MKHKIGLLVLLGSFLAAAAWSAVESHPRKPYGDFFARQIEARADSLTGFDIQKYEITLDINHQTHQIAGNVLATVLAEDNLSSIQYNLVGLTVSSVLVNGVAAAYTHTGGIINISLNIPSGQTFSTQVFYSGVPQLSGAPYNIGMIFSANTVFTISDPDAGRYWWPCYDHPWDKAVVDLHITLRGDWKVAANGIRTSIVDNGDGTSTTHWIGEHPMTTYLVCITAGPYVEINQTAGDIPIQSFVTQNQYNNALVDFANVPAMINYFSQVFGPYPFEKYGHAVVSMSTYGAMEHQTMTTLGNFIITGNGTYELIIAHELAHQWYGNAVSFLTFKDVWLSEGFATYSEHLWVDHTLGWQAAADYIYTSYHQYYLNWAAGAGPQTIYDPAFNYYFAPPSYEKAASVLHMLRLKIGNANFFQLLQDWFSAWSGGNAVTSEFQALAEQISGQDLNQFFQQWIYGSGTPELEYSVWNNSNSDQPLRIEARTRSNTPTNFEIQVPFRFVNGADSDSLLVNAFPNGVCNSFSLNYDSASVLEPNHNHWALLRNVTELKPALTECLPSNSAVLLSWEPFLDNQNLAYYVYRRPLQGVPEWQQINPEALNELSFLDSSAENGTAYQYAVRAIDASGYLSEMSNFMAATPVAFSFANDLLVVDETRDGTGANINPDDAMVDAFYAAALSPIVYEDWDVATQGLPGLDILGQYRLILWHADDFAQNLLIDHLNVLGGYLLGGGKVLLSGWKTTSVLSDTFLQRFGGNVDLVYDNSAGLIGAESTQYPELLVDPLKTIPTWNQMLPYIYTFLGTSNSLYTANMSTTSLGNGNSIAFRRSLPASGSEFVLLGLPLYFMQADGVRGFLQAIIPDLLSPVANHDPAVPPISLSLSVSPNPFQSRTILRFTLAEKGSARLGIYNLKGQLVRELLFGEKSHGTYDIAFDGRDGKGSPLASGIYIIRMDSGGKSISKKVSLIK
ncbi:MAG: T9SS type A sorting domain-containing protein [Candidatus Syntrophosphaera sp.]|nr:T9SS type A sorting domain-containing protein [Candidatus Syntrophosphaera sp.]